MKFAIDNPPIHFTRTIECHTPRSDKFWQATIDGCVVDVRYGKTNTAGQSLPEPKRFPSYAAAVAWVDTTIATKIAQKGYVEVGPNAPAAAQAPAAPAVDRLFPMLASEKPIADMVRYVEDPAFALDIKVNGDRTLVEVRAMVGGVNVNVFGKNGQRSKHTEQLRSPRFMADFARLDANYLLLDGEFVVGPDGRWTLWLFDVVNETDADGATRISPTDPLWARRARLERLYATWDPATTNIRLVETATTHTDKGALALRCIRERMEGLVAKRLDSTYRWAIESPDWVKLKITHTVDCHITAVGFDGKEDAELTVYDDVGTPVVVGKVSTRGKRGAVLGAVVEVRYKGISTDKRRLVNPRIIRVRDPEEKTGLQCLVYQLIEEGPRV